MPPPHYPANAAKYTQLNARAHTNTDTAGTSRKYKTLHIGTYRYLPVHVAFRYEHTIQQNELSTAQARQHGNRAQRSMSTVRKPKGRRAWAMAAWMHDNKAAGVGKVRGDANAVRVTNIAPHAGVGAAALMPRL